MIQKKKVFLALGSCQLRRSAVEWSFIYHMRIIRPFTMIKHAKLKLTLYGVRTAVKFCWRKKKRSKCICKETAEQNY